MAVTIKDRVREFKRVSAAELQDNQGNWRTHPKAQAEALRGILHEVGVAGALTAYYSQRQGGKLTLIDGHLRRQAHGDLDWPVLILDVDDREADLLLASLDPLAALAEADKAQLDKLLQQAQTTDPALQQMLADLADANNLYQDKAELGDTPDAKLDQADELQVKWQTAQGQLWQIGVHRLYIGDSKLAESYERLMQGKLAAMIWTDPPYGVSYGDKNAHLNAADGGNRIETNITDDKLDIPALTELLRTVFAHTFKQCAGGGAWYVAAPAGPHFLAFGAVLAELEVWRQTIVWVKDSFVLGRQDYHYRHEAMFYGWKPGASHTWLGGRDQDTVWEIKRPKKSGLHPTMKPPELVARALVNGSTQHDICLDPFAGSGTTLVAAEAVHRVGYGIELEAKYGAVILERLSEMNLTPKLVS